MGLYLCLCFTHIVGEVNSYPRPEDTSAAPTSSVLFREIHKNAWLKRLPSTDKKTTGAFPKVWHKPTLLKFKSKYSGSLL
jgi:hypothetical protein